MSSTGTIALTTPEQISMFGLLQVRGRLHLELRGLGFRASTLKPLQRLGITSRGTKWGALVDLNRHIASLGGPRDRLMLALQRDLAKQGKPHAIHLPPPPPMEPEECFCWTQPSDPHVDPRCTAHENF